MTAIRSSAWLALSNGGPVAALATFGARRNLRITANPATFAGLLRDVRPRIAILAVPPAGWDDIDGVLAERRRRPSMRVVVLSPPDAIEARLQGLRAGVDEAHADTIDPVELEGRLMLLDARARVRRTSILPVTDDVSLDLVAHEVRRAGALVHLRPKEFQLLATLATHPGRAYTRRQLLDRVWGHDHDGDPRTVDVHVRWLRSKLEPRPETPVHLITVRGVGYRLDPAAG
ncbi:MAG: winged helix-turn-helix domain-containing protein [Candidatus Limnocylindrales bacterium]